MRLLIFAALLILTSCTKEHHDVTPPVPFDATQAVNRLYFNPEYNGSQTWVRFTIPVSENLNKIELSKRGVTLDSKTTVTYGAVDLYDKASNRFPVRDSVYTFTITNSKGEISTANFKMP
jgi:uncharacterized membrane protein